MKRSKGICKKCKSKGIKSIEFKETYFCLKCNKYFGKEAKQANGC